MEAFACGGTEEADPDRPSIAPTQTEESAICLAEGEFATVAPCPDDEVSDFLEFGEGITGERSQLPASPPDGYVQLTEYFEFKTLEGAVVTVKIPVRASLGSYENAAFYTYANGQWQLVAAASVYDAGPNLGGILAEAEFNPLPENFVVFAESH